MRLAVVIATQDRPHFLRSCLESVRAQTYPAAQVVVVDDGDDPDTPAICGAIIPETIVVRSGRSGIAVANNLGLDQVTADAVVPMGDDDLMLPDRLANHARVLKAGADVATSGWINFSVEARQLEFVTAHPAPTLEALLRESTVIGQGAAAYSSRQILRHRYDSRLSMGCDMDLNARLLAAGAKFVHSETFTVLRRLHLGSVTTRFAGIQRSVKDDLRHRYGIDPDREEASENGAAAPATTNRRVSIDWATALPAIAAAGIDPDRLNFGRAARTLGEAAASIAHFADDAVIDLLPRAPGRIGAALVCFDDPRTLPSLRFRERLLAVPRVSGATPEPPPTSLADWETSLGLNDDGGRLVVDVERVTAGALVKLEASLSQISPQWRFIGQSAAIDAAFRRPVAMAAISTRFTNRDRLGAAGLRALDAIADARGDGRAQASTRLRAVQRAEDRIVALEFRA